jgi:hypothetical protein
MDPLTIGMLGSTGAGLLGSLFGGKKKKTEYDSTKAPQAQGLENSINQYYQSMMGKPTPYVPMNKQMFEGANILSNAYGGGPYTHYGNQQMGMQGQPRQMSGMPQGGSQMPQAPSQMPQGGGGMGQGGMPPWLAHMQAAKAGMPQRQ